MNDKYKVGDRVTVKHHLVVNCNGGVGFIKDMFKYCRKRAIITELKNNIYLLDIDDGEWNWEDWMLDYDISIICKEKLERIINGQ